MVFFNQEPVTKSITKYNISYFFKIEDTKKGKMSRIGLQDVPVVRGVGSCLGDGPQCRPSEDMMNGVGAGFGNLYR